MPVKAARLQLWLAALFSTKGALWHFNLPPRYVLPLCNSCYDINTVYIFFHLSSLFSLLSFFNHPNMISPLPSLSVNSYFFIAVDAHTYLSIDTHVPKYTHTLSHSHTFTSFTYLVHASQQSLVLFKPCLLMSTVRFGHFLSGLEMLLWKCNRLQITSYSI